MDHRVDKLIADIESVSVQVRQLATAYEQTGQVVAARDFADIHSEISDALAGYRDSVAAIRYCRYCAKDSDHSNLPCTPGGPHAFETRDARKARIRDESNK